MAVADGEFSLAEAGSAPRALQDDLGLPEERFPISAFVGMISDEIEKARAAGRSDEPIAQLVSNAAGKVLTAAQIAQHYTTPEQRQATSIKRVPKSPGRGQKNAARINATAKDTSGRACRLSEMWCGFVLLPTCLRFSRWYI